MGKLPIKMAAGLFVLREFSWKMYWGIFFFSSCIVNLSSHLFLSTFGSASIIKWFTRWRCVKIAPSSLSVKKKIILSIIGNLLWTRINSETMDTQWKQQMNILKHDVVCSLERYLYWCMRAIPYFIIYIMLNYLI